MLTDEQLDVVLDAYDSKYSTRGPRDKYGFPRASYRWDGFLAAYKALLPVIVALEREVKHACHATPCGMEVSGNPEDCDCGWYRASRAVEQTTREAGL